MQKLSKCRQPQARQNVPGSALAALSRKRVGGPTAISCVGVNRRAKLVGRRQRLSQPSHPIDVIGQVDVAGLQPHFSGTLTSKSLMIVWKVGCPTS